jgi:hypothetical protein
MVDGMQPALKRKFNDSRLTGGIRGDKGDINQSN